MDILNIHIPFFLYIFFLSNKIIFRILEFSIKIGGAFNSETCRQPRSRNEAVIVDYSTDNGITWKVLKVVEPTFEDIKPSSVVINLPSDARKNRTVFRFWQPLGLGGKLLPCINLSLNADD